MENVIDLVLATKWLLTRPDMEQKHGAHARVLLEFCGHKNVSKRRKRRKVVVNG